MKVAVAMDDHIDTRQKYATTHPEEPVITNLAKNCERFKKSTLKIARPPGKAVTEQIWQYKLRRFAGRLRALFLTRRTLL